MTDGYIFVKLNNKCNSLCNFCADDWAVRNKKEPSFEEIKEEILKGRKKGFSKLIISGGEPTISKNLFKVISFAREEGVDFIHLVTNARLLGVRSFFNKIKDEVDRFQVSFFASNPKTFDRISGVNGAFRQSFQALINLRRAKKDVIVNAVVTKDNYTEMLNLIILLIALDVSYIQFAFPNPTGFAKSNKVFVKYSEIVPYVEEAIKLSNYLNFKSIGFENFPLCVFKDWRNVKPFLSDLSHPKENKGYYTQEKVYSEECDLCGFKGECEGVFKEYQRIFGLKELSRLV